MRPPVRLFSLALAAASLVMVSGIMGWGHADRSRAAAAPPLKSVPETQRAGTAPTPSRPSVAESTKAASPAPAKPPVQTPLAQPQAEAPKPVIQTKHTVEAGETLSGIAHLYGVSTAKIKSANGLTSDQIRQGQAIVIPGAQPLRRHRVEQGDSLWEVASKYGVNLEALLAANPRVEDPGHLQIGQELVVPPRAAVVAVATPTPESDLSLGGLFVWPNASPVSSTFGPRWGRNHNGIDLAANHGDPILAARSGRVELSGEVSGYGNTVIIRHPDGTRTLYAHASRLLVKAGQEVTQGQTIALVGSTGQSTGPHLHFEIIVNDRPRDPMLYLPKK